MIRVRFAGLAVAMLTVAVLATGCTARSHYVYPTPVKDRFLITTGDIDRPYVSLGYLQLTRKGADFFGFISVVDANLEALFGRELISELERAGAHGIINVRFHERQWTTAQRIPFVLLFFIPLPTQVELSGEMIRFQAPQGAPTPAPGT